MNKFFISILLVFIYNIQAFAGPYVFDDKTQASITTIATITGFAFSITNSDFKPHTEYQVELLMNKKLLGINQISVDNFSDANALVSDVLLGVCIAVPALQIFDGRVKQDWGIYGLMYLESAALSVSTTTLTKNIFRETRPYVYSTEAPMEMKLTKDARQSFFSGHACLAFAGMTFFAETYGNYYPETSNHTLIWLGSMTLASTTALLRVFSGRHFPIDILVGSAVGFAIGKLIPYLHKNKDLQNEYPDFKVSRIVAFNFNI